MISCRDCQYPLKGLGAHYCPECGRDFDPADPRTYFTAGRWLTRVAAIVGVLAAMLVLLSYGIATVGILDYALDPTTESLMLLPGAGLLGLYGGAPLLLIVIVFYKRLTSAGRVAFSIITALGLTLLPSIVCLARLFGW